MAQELKNFKEFWKEPFRLEVIGPTQCGKTTYVEQLIRMLQEPPDPMFQQIYVFSSEKFEEIFNTIIIEKQNNKVLIVIDDNIRSISLKDQRQISDYGVSIIWIGQEIVEGFSNNIVLLGPLSKRDEHIAAKKFLPTFEIMSIIKNKPFHFVLLRFAEQSIYDTYVVEKNIIIEKIK